MSPNERKIDIDGDFERNALLDALAQLIGNLAGEPVAGFVYDDDNAATAGTDLFVVPNEDLDSRVGHFESTTAGNADTVFTIGDGGPTVYLTDSDTPGGVAVYFNEATGRFIAVLPAGHDLTVLSVDGHAIRVFHDPAAATNGVAVHVDDNAAPDEKLLFVSPTNTDGAFDTATAVTINLAEASRPTKRPQFEQHVDGSITLTIVDVEV